MKVTYKIWDGGIPIEETLSINIQEDYTDMFQTKVIEFIEDFLFGLNFTVERIEEDD